MYGFILFMLCISFSAPIITMESPDTPRLKRRGSTEELPPMPHAPKKLCSAQPRITNKEKVPPLTILATRAIRRESGFETHDDEIIINHGKLRKWLDKIIKTPADCTKTIFNIFCKNLNQPGDPAKERQKKIDGLHYMRNALLLKGACAAMITGLIEAEANHAHTLNRDSLDDGSECVLHALSLAQEMDLHPRFASVLPVFINASLKKLIDRNETELIEKLFKCNVQLASIRGLLSHIENSYAQELKTMDPLLIALTKGAGYFLHRYKDHHNKICYLMSSQQLDHRQIKSVADSQEYSPLTNRIKASKEVMQDIVSKEDKALPLKRNLGFSLQE